MPHPTTIDTAHHPYQQDQHHHQHIRQDSVQHASTGASSPIAPAYSPITPKVQPAILNTTFAPPDSHGGTFTFSPSLPPESRHLPIASPAQFIPQPPNRPFSSEDATDAIAIRAAISTLQFQKKKAQEDIKTLESIKLLALDDPSHFKAEFASGKLYEQKPRIGDLRAILDQDDDSSDDEEDEVQLGATRDDDEKKITPVMDNKPAKMNVDTAKTFPPIPGPQSVVRMPPINWDKYGIVGEPLESIHAQQQRWPGTPAFAKDRGREHTIAAPYSPWLDTLDVQTEKDFTGTATSTPGVSATGTISEHPMETRSRN